MVSSHKLRDFGHGFPIKSGIRQQKLRISSTKLGKGSTIAEVSEYIGHGQGINETVSFFEVVTGHVLPE